MCAAHTRRSRACLHYISARNSSTRLGMELGERRRETGKSIPNCSFRIIYDLAAKVGQGLGHYAVRVAWLCAPRPHSHTHALPFSPEHSDTRTHRFKAPSTAGRGKRGVGPEIEADKIGSCTCYCREMFRHISLYCLIEYGHVHGRSEHAQAHKSNVIN